MNLKKSHSRNPFRHARQTAKIKVAAYAIFATKEQGLSQGHETFHADDSFVNLRCIDTHIKFSPAICTGFFVFHSKPRRTGLNKVELIYLMDIPRSFFFRQAWIPVYPERRVLYKNCEILCEKWNIISSSMIFYPHKLHFIRKQPKAL